MADRTAAPARGAGALPFTLFFLLAMLAANALAGTVGGALPREALEAFGLAHVRLADGEVWRIVTATFLSHDAGMLMRQFVFAALVIGAYEWRNGWRRAAAMFAATDILGTLAVVFLVIAPLSGLTHAALAGIAAQHDVGMSAGGFGIVGALAAQGARPRFWFAAILAALAAKLALAPDIIPDAAHILSLAIGYTLQRASGRAREGGARGARRG